MGNESTTVALWACSYELMPMFVDIYMVFISHESNSHIVLAIASYLPFSLYVIGV
jgi:hypothetical protein